MTNTDNPGIRVPPPLVFAGLTELGLLAHARLASGLLLFVGIAVGLLGLALIVGSLDRFRRAKVRPEPWQPAARLIIAGLYGYSRNPMYLGMAVLALGVAGTLTSLPGAIGAVVAALLIDRFVIRREEEYLLRTFGHTYADYCIAVPRWLGRFPFSRQGW